MASYRFTPKAQRQFARKLERVHDCYSASHSPSEWKERFLAHGFGSRFDYFAKKYGATSWDQWRAWAKGIHKIELPEWPEPKKAPSPSPSPTQAPAQATAPQAPISAGEMDAAKAREVHERATMPNTSGWQSGKPTITERLPEFQDIPNYNRRSRHHPIQDAGGWSAAGAGALRRALETERAARVERDLESGALDPDKLAEIGAGFGNSRPFLDSTPGRALSAAVQIYIDHSGSTSAADGTARSRLDHMKRAAAAVYAACRACRVPVEIVGYSSTGFPIAPFGCAPRAAVAMLASTVSAGGNNTGAAIVSMSRRLARRAERRKIGIVFTDGDIQISDWRSEVVPHAPEAASIEWHVIGVGAFWNENDMQEGGAQSHRLPAWNHIDVWAESKEWLTDLERVEIATCRMLARALAPHVGAAIG